MKRLSELLKGMESELNHHSVTLAHLLEVLGTRGHSLFTFFLSIPFLLPIPMPGLSVAVGALFVIVGVRFFMGKGPWIPKPMQKLKLPRESFKKIFHFAGQIAKKLEPFVRPRYERVFEWKLIKKWEGLVIACCGFFLALPLPPGTNFPPALVILIFSLANLEKDGYLAVFASILFFVNILFFSVIGYAGIEGVHYFIRNFMT